MKEVDAGDVDQMSPEHSITKGGGRSSKGAQLSYLERFMAKNETAVKSELV